MSSHGEESRDDLEGRFAAYDRRIAEITWDSRRVALLATLPGTSFEHTGHLWWKKYAPPRPYLEWALTSVDEDSPFPKFDDGLDFEGEVLEEFARGVFRYVGVDYSIAWLPAAEVDQLWEEFGC